MTKRICTARVNRNIALSLLALLAAGSCLAGTVTTTTLVELGSQSCTSLCALSNANGAASASVNGLSVETSASMGEMPESTDYASVMLEDDMTELFTDGLGSGIATLSLNYCITSLDTAAGGSPNDSIAVQFGVTSTTFTSGCPMTLSSAMTITTPFTYGEAFPLDFTLEAASSVIELGESAYADAMILAFQDPAGGDSTTPEPSSSWLSIVGLVVILVIMACRDYAKKEWR
jgi:hypothetical protein